MKGENLRKIINRLNAMSLPLKASLGFMVATIFEKGVNLITIPIFTRILTEVEYGRVNVYKSWSSILSVIVTFSLVGGVINNAMIEFEDERDKFLSSTLSLIFISSFIYYILYKIIEKSYGPLLNFDNKLIIFMFLSFAFNSSLGILGITKRFHFDYKLILFFSLIVAFFSPLFSIFLIKKTSLDGVSAKIYGDGVVLLTINVLIFLKILIQGKSFFNFKHWKFALKFNVPLIPHYISHIVLAQADRVMISKYIGDDKAGIYSLAYTIAAIITIITGAINSSFIPWTYKKMREKNYKDIEKATNKLIILGSGFTIIFVLIAPEFIKFMGPPSYYEAINIMPPIVYTFLVVFVFTFFANIEFYHKKTILVMVASVIASVTNIVLNILLIPKFGYFAAAYTTLISYITLMIMHFLFMKKIEKNRIYNEKLIFITLALIGFITQSLVKIYDLLFIRYILLFILISLGGIFYFIEIKKKKKIYISNNNDYAI